MGYLHSVLGTSSASSGNSPRGDVERPAGEPLSPSYVESGRTSSAGDFAETARTSSVYALNESDGSRAVFGGSLQPDLNQLLALGRAPTRQRLSEEEARALPRVRFEAPGMQNCSICLEPYVHGMLLSRLF